MKTKTIYTIEEAWVDMNYKELKNLYSGYAFVETECIDNLGYYDSYELAFEHFSNLQPILKYDKYYEKYYLTEYVLLEYIENEYGDLISHNTYLMDKKYNF